MPPKNLCLFILSALLSSTTRPCENCPNNGLCGFEYLDCTPAGENYQICSGLRNCHRPLTNAETYWRMEARRCNLFPLSLDDESPTFAAQCSSELPPYPRTAQGSVTDGQVADGRAVLILAGIICCLKRGFCCCKRSKKKN